MSGTWKVFLGEAKEKLVVIANSVCCYFLFTNHVASISYCKGPSMLPTFNASGDVILVDLVTTKYGKLEEGDVVVSKSPIDPKMMICKRIIGLEGDTVIVTPSRAGDSPFQVTVPRGHVWLQGDNLRNSTDSRQYGPVPRALLMGKVLLKIWPPSEIGPINKRP